MALKLSHCQVDQNDVSAVLYPRQIFANAYTNFKKRGHRTRARTEQNEDQLTEQEQEQEH